MKCPACQISHSYRDGMTCACGYTFALDPKTDRYTDGKMLAAISRASAEDTYHFTQNQLYSATFAPKKSPLGCIVLIMSVIGLVFGLVAMGAEELLPLLFIVVMVGFVMLISFAIPDFSALNRDRFQTLLQKYIDAKGKPRKLLDKPELHEPPPNWEEDDIFAYGVERILVVQHDLLVDLLVKNGVHAANRMLVLSGSGYPDYLVPHATRFLNENPNLSVFFLHDSTNDGVAWFNTISQSDKLPWAGHPIVDLGLQPDDVSKINKLKRIPKSGSGVPVDYLPNMTLSAGLAGAMDQGVAFAALLAAEEKDPGASTASFG